MAKTFHRKNIMSSQRPLSERASVRHREMMSRGEDGDLRIKTAMKRMGRHRRKVNKMMSGD